MPLPTRWHKNKKNKRKPPDGFEYIEATLEALEHELRDKSKESNVNKRKTESVWPIHQINWQKSRYVYDMYYTYKRISKQVYQYCLDQKYVDAALIAKWKKPGYERLCSTYVINSTNYKFGTTSICRVPTWDRSIEAQTAQDPTTGCLGCACGVNKRGIRAGPKNIFGNKYGQYLASVQVAREERLAKLREKQKKAAAAAAAAAKQQQQQQNDDDDDDDDDSTDDDSDDDDDGSGGDDDDYGPTPAAGIWAGSQKLQDQSERMIHGADNDNDDDATTDDEDGDDDDDDDDGPIQQGQGQGQDRPLKKQRT